MWKLFNCWAGRLSLVATGIGLSFLGAGCAPSVEQMLAAYQERGAYQALSLRYPLNQTVFPPEIAPCTFEWQEGTNQADTWLILFEFAGGPGRRVFRSHEPQWTPKRADWESIKQQSREQPTRVTVLGFRRAMPTTILSRGQISISSSKDPVGAPIFYREVNLPFKEAVKDPTRIRWRFGTIDSVQPPPVVLEHLPVCGNCHSFSQDGRLLGMDVDYANNKGSYVLTPVAKEMTLASSDILTWSDYQRNEGEQTFGLLSQVSPDGQAAISTVKDKSVFVPKPDLAFSQLFFPIQGILAVYRKDTRTFAALPGADDSEYVQSNPTWSPDGQYIVFARAKAYRLRNQGAQGKLLLSEEDCAEFLREGKPFRFDLYRVPYNHGRGGTAEPLAGASGNGRSNFFPKYSPDGKWIIFCQANNYMLLQPDSELYLIPAAGGTARRLASNTARMNSWHSWSPNSRWLVFSSKANSPYTQLFLTHIDEAGASSPPVVLAQFTAPDRAANIPEFVNAPPGAIAKIQEQFLDDNSHARAAYAFELSGDYPKAIAAYEQALKINPRNVHAHQRLGFLLYNIQRQFPEGLAHTTEALRLDPKDGCAHYDMGMALKHRGQLKAALSHLAEAVRLLPNGFDSRYSAVEMRCAWGNALLANGQAPEATAVLTKTLELEPKSARAHYLLAIAQAAQGAFEEALQHYETARTQRPDLDTSPELHLMFSAHQAESGHMNAALESARKALKLAQAYQDTRLIEAINERIVAYQEQLDQK